MTKIGVFDSGIGGEAVAKAIAVALPDLEIVLKDDKQHAPYGEKLPQELLRLVTPILDTLIDEGCQVLVIACNTVTTTIISQLRHRYDMPLIGIEPMVKPACELTKNKVIAVCATPATLQSPRYQWLKKHYSRGTKVLEPDCSQWAPMIEANQVNHERIARQINTLCEQGADVIVLGCTHYHWIKEDIMKFAEGRAEILQPEAAVVSQLKSVLARLT
jgi:glutamate racemase